MTQPRQAKRRNTRGPRTYAWPPLPPHEFEVISVTSAISGGIPKPWLTGWAAKVTAEAAVDDHDVITAMLAKPNGERAAIDHIKGARYRDSGTKADRGTIVHSALEAYLAGKPMGKETVEAALKDARVPRGLWRSAAAMINGLMEFLYDEEPEVFWSEQTVYSRTHGYAGTPDLLALMTIGGSRKPTVVDVKTSKSIYDDTALQLCAYARADFVGLDDGTEAQLTPDGAPIEHGVVVRPTPSGKYEKATFSLTDPVFERFLGALTVARLDGVEGEARRPA